MFKKLIVGVVAGALILGTVPTGAAMAAGCKDATMIFARGSGEKVGGENYQEMKEALEEEVAERTSGLKVGYYELKEYPAVDVGMFWRAVSTKISAGQGYAFGRSVRKGQQELINFVRAEAALCPEEKFILAGYSQGALVIMGALPQLDAKRVAYVVTFGDPKLYLPEGYGKNPDACKGKNLSEYRAWAPDCRTDHGILGAKQPYHTAPYRGKIGAWCNAADFMCGSYFKFSDLMAGHTTYSKNQSFDQAASKMVTALATTYPQKVILRDGKTASAHDLAILIDTSGSMVGMIDHYKTEALKLAKRVINASGRVALYEYRDLDDPFSAREVVKMGRDITRFKEGLDSLQTDGGGDLDESLLSATLHVMNTVRWRKGALKSIVVITDAGYHSPDKDGVTQAQVVRRSLEIDPVNIYIIATGRYEQYYNDQGLARETGGVVMGIEQMEEMTEWVAERTDVKLDQEYYSGLVGETLRFVASGGESYDWDLNMDGEFEIVGGGAVTETSYAAPMDGFIQVRTRGASGATSTMSAAVYIEAPTDTAKISEVKVERMNSAAVISYRLSGARTIAAVDEAVLGVINGEQLTVTELSTEAETTVTLIPVSAGGRRGEPVTVTLPPTKTVVPKKAPNSGVYK